MARERVRGCGLGGLHVFTGKNTHTIANISQNLRTNIL